MQQESTVSVAGSPACSRSQLQQLQVGSLQPGSEGATVPLQVKHQFNFAT